MSFEEFVKWFIEVMGREPSEAEAQRIKFGLASNWDPKRIMAGYKAMRTLRSKYGPEAMSLIRRKKPAGTLSGDPRLMDLRRRAHSLVDDLFDVIETAVSR